MKKTIKLALVLLLLLAGINLWINSSTADSKYDLNSDLIKQISANVPG